jgi:hypothetical protein
LLKINYSPDNKNSAFLKKFPEILVYLRLLLLDSTGEVLYSQDGRPLEEGKSYNFEKFRAFPKIRLLEAGIRRNDNSEVRRQ